MTHENFAELNLALMENSGGYHGGLLLGWGAYLLNRGPGLLRHLAVSLACWTLSIAQATISSQMLSQQTASQRQGGAAPSRARSMPLLPMFTVVWSSLLLPQDCEGPREHGSQARPHIRFTSEALKTYGCLGPSPRDSDLIG